jgi:hypothetical protein
MKNAAHSRALLLCISPVSGNKTIARFCGKRSAARGCLALTMPWNMAALVAARSRRRWKCKRHTVKSTFEPHYDNILFLPDQLAKSM